MTETKFSYLKIDALPHGGFSVAEKAPQGPARQIKAFSNKTELLTWLDHHLPGEAALSQFLRAAQLLLARDAARTDRQAVPEGSAEAQRLREEMEGFASGLRFCVTRDDRPPQ